MNDEPASDALSRASAYLDGELDAREMRSVEADPAVMVEVARLRTLREAIRDVQAPSSYARDLAIDAALGEFDRIHRPVAPVLRAKPRPSYSRWLAVAAAVAGLAALGAVITATARGGNGGDSDAAGAGASAEQSAEAFDTNATDRSAAAGGAVAPAAPQPESAQSQTLAAATEAPATTSAAAGAAEASVESAAAATAAAPASTAPAADTFAQFDPNTPIADDVELGRVGRQLLAEWQSGTRESKVGTECDASIPGAVLLSDGLVIVNGATRTVLIAANPETDDTFALDPDSCVVVMTGASG